MTAVPPGAREAGPRMLLPSHFRAALGHVPATATWYEDIEEALSVPGRSGCGLARGRFRAGQRRRGIVRPG